MLNVLVAERLLSIRMIRNHIQLMQVCRLHVPWMRVFLTQKIFSVLVKDKIIYGT